MKHATVEPAIGLDPLSTTTLISLGSGVVGLFFLPFVGPPAVAAWPWIAISVIIHLFYFGALIEAYRTGDLGQVYPIARGSAPLMMPGLSGKKSTSTGCAAASAGALA